LHAETVRLLGFKAISLPPKSAPVILMPELYFKTYKNLSLLRTLGTNIDLSQQSLLLETRIPTQSEFERQLALQSAKLTVEPERSFPP
jgi:hypothetical protein